MLNKSNFTRFLIIAAVAFVFAWQYNPISVEAQKTSNFQKLPINERQNIDRERSVKERKKLAPDLDKKIKDSFYSYESEKTQKVIIKLTKKKVNQFKSRGHKLSSKTARMELNNKFKKLRGKYNKSFENFDIIVAELPLYKVRELAKDADVEYISPDREIASNGHVADTTGAATAWYNTNGVSGGAQGNGVGVAILDSGIDEYHSLMWGNSRRKVIYEKDFTNENNTQDKFGHGTHVASMASGNWSNEVGGRYQAIAPHVDLLNLKVLDRKGMGNVSDAIEAIDWAISKKNNYNIRVLNISFGTPAQDSYENDPLCLAARRAFDAGILVVASAGNNGKSASGEKLYGSINSPGIDPSVLTVGAANTYGTNYRMDDTVTSFSSRGPTRGYKWVNGNKVYDNLIKPDIVAPGNRLIGAKSAASKNNSYSLVRKHPSLDVNSNWSNSEGVMYLSGTSMAAPIASGAAAMLFQARPDLTPGMVKAILMYTAQPLDGFNTLEQGAGLINIKGATEIVNILKPNAMSLGNGSWMLTGTLTNQFGNGQCSWIAYSSICYPWGKGVITNYGFLYGDNLMKYKQGIYNNGVIMGDGTYMSGNNLVRKTWLTSNGVGVFRGVTMGDGVIMGDGSIFVDSSDLFSNMFRGVTMGDGVIMGDGVMMGDNYGNPTATTANQAVYGDNTSAMQP